MIPYGDENGRFRKRTDEYAQCEYEVMSDFLYIVGYRFNSAWRIVTAWRPHYLWCQARAFRNANSSITMPEGAITLASCKCGVARAYNSVGPIRAGCLIRSSAFKL